MHIAIISTRPAPDQDVYAREQSAALASLGHDVTVIAPGPTREASTWAFHSSVQSFTVDWRDDLDRVRRLVRDIGVDVAHAYEVRGVSRLLRSLSVPAVLEIRSVPLRAAPWRLAGVARMCLAARLAAATGTSHLRLPAIAPWIQFTAPAGWSSWAADVPARRDPVPGRIVYQGTPSARRRFDLLADALSQVARRHPELHVLALFRPSPAADSSGWIPLKQALGDRLEIREPTGPEDLVEAMAGAHASLSWVPNGGGFRWQPPLKALDSLAAGVPLVATSTPATVAAVAGNAATLTDATPAAFAHGLQATIEAPTTTPQPDAEFLSARSWRGIMQGVWVPRYQAVA